MSLNVHTVVILLNQVNDKDRRALIALATKYFRNIIEVNAIVSDKLTNAAAWSEARRATINKPPETTIMLRQELKKEFIRVLGPVAAQDFDTVLLTFMLGRRLDT